MSSRCENHELMTAEEDEMSLPHDVVSAEEQA